MKDLKNIFFRAIFFYLIAGLFVFYAIDHKKVSEHAWPKTLSRLRVDYVYLINTANGASPSKAEFIDGKRYFNAIASIYGERSDVDAFLGMSSYYLGDHGAAKRYFLKVREKATGFFWAYYNLALLAYQDKDYSAAAEYCKQAFQSPMDKSLEFMVGSKVYQPLLIENGITPQLMAQDMEGGQVLLAQLLMMMKSGAVRSLGEKLPIRVF